jgi:hypothetical protein
MVLVNWIDTGATIVTVALPVVPVLGTPLLGTVDPAVQLLAVDRMVKVAGGSQADMVPTFHVTVFPPTVAVPFDGEPTTPTADMQAFTASVTVTVWLARLDTVRFRNAVCP